MSKLLKLTALLGVCSTAAAQLPPVPGEADPNAEPVPHLFVGLRTVDLGSVLEGDVVPVGWLLENRGSSNLQIESAKASCGCTIVKLGDDERMIPPGGSLELKAELHSAGRRGQQRKVVTVRSNDPAEPTLKLHFTAEVVPLYDVTPSGAMNLRNVQRDTPAAKTLNFTPSAGRTSLEILDVEMEHPKLLQAVVGPFQSRGGIAGKSVRFSVTKQAQLGTLMTSVTVRLRVDDLERVHKVVLRAEVVADLTWLPRVVDATRQPSLRGKRLAPVKIRSTDKMPFDVLGAQAGPLLDVSFEPVLRAPQGTQYEFHLTVREDATSGPFGTMLEVRTSFLDQPVISVPVFGIVAAPITVDPPLVLLRRDGTPTGTQRRVKLQTSPRWVLEVSEVTCPVDAIVVELRAHPSPRHTHIRFLDVRLTEPVPQDLRETMITVTTSIAGAETLRIPVYVEAPKP